MVRNKFVAILKVMFTVLLTISCCLLVTAYSSSEEQDNQNKLIINQVYGGAAANNGTSVSHSFIELYNPTSSEVSLESWSIQYAESGDRWQILPLRGSIAPEHSFLIRGNESNEGARLIIEDFDMEWDIFLNNKGIKVVLLSSVEPLTVSNPFVDMPDHYVDMIGVAGSNLFIDGFEMDFLQGQSKQKSLRRKGFRDTDNNAWDLEIIDFNEASLEINRPRSLKDGPWTQEPPNDNGQKPREVNFSDLPPTEPFSMPVGLMVKLGIIEKQALFFATQPITEKQFYTWLYAAAGRQEENEDWDSRHMTLEECVDAALHLLGYGTVIEHMKMDPMTLAHTEGLLKNIDAKPGDELNRGQAAIFVANSLEVLNIDVYSVGSKIEYAQIYKNWLTDIHGINKIEGIIIDRPYYEATSDKTSLRFISRFGEDIMCRFGGDQSISDMLGFNITAFIRDAYFTGEQPEIIFAVKNGVNKELRIKKSWYNDVVSVTDDAITLSYTDDEGVERRANISRQGKFVYNGALSQKLRQRAEAMLKNAFKPSHTGNITLLDHNNDNMYDYVFVRNYKDIVVDGIDRENMVITNKLRYNSSTSDSIADFDEIKQVELDSENKNYQLRFLDSNDDTVSEAITFNDIKKDSVISVGLSSLDEGDDALVRNVYISDRQRSGQITETYVDGGDIYFIVDTREYKGSKSYNQTFERGDSDTASFFGVWDYVTFYLNYDGRICYAVVNKHGLEYGIILNVAETKGIAKDLEMAFLDSQNQLKKLSITEKQYKNFGLDKLVYPAVVKAVINEQTLVAVRTHLDTNGTMLEYRGKLQYKAATSRLGDMFLDEQTQIYVYDGNRGDENSKNSLYYRNVDWAALNSSVDMDTDISAEVDVDVYDIEKKYKPGLVIFYNSQNRLFLDPGLAGVTNITRGIDQDGELSDFLYLMYKGSEQRFRVDESLIEELPKEKDIIRIALNAQGEVSKIDVVYSENTEEFTLGTAFERHFYALRNKVLSVDDGIVTVEVNGQYESYRATEQTNVYGIKEDLIRTCNLEDLIADSRVMIYQKDGLLHDVFVVEGVR